MCNRSRFSKQRNPDDSPKPTTTIQWEIDKRYVIIGTPPNGEEFSSEIADIGNREEGKRLVEYNETNLESRETD